MRGFFQDLRYSARILFKSPAFTLVTLLTLTIGIGANTCIFTIIDSVLLRPLPYKDPERLVSISNSFAKENLDHGLLSVPELEDLQSQAESIEALTAYVPLHVNLTGAIRTERLSGMEVTTSYFSVLGVEPILGRGFLPEDYQTGITEIAIISHNLWENLFGRDPNIIGRSLILDYDSYTIIGVLPRDFRAPGNQLGSDFDVWTPAGFKTAPFPPPSRNDRHLSIVARLRKGTDLNRARSELKTISRRLIQDHADQYDSGWSMELTPLHDVVIGNVRPALLVLLSAVFLVLLIACANVANLMLVRAIRRQKEMALRTALGATALRLIRQLLCESLLVSLIGGGLGYLVAIFGLKVLFALSPPNLPRLHEIGPNSSVLLFTFGLSLFAGTAFGLLPAIEATRTNTIDMIKEGSANVSTGTRNTKLRNLFVIGQFALALMLLVGAGLLLKSFWNVRNVNPGFNPQNLMTVELWLPYPNKPETGKYFRRDQRAAFFDQILERVEALPGVKSAGMISLLPFNTERADRAITIEGQEYRGPQDLAHAESRSVSANYFLSMGIPLITGRYFTKQDDEKSPGVVIINDAMSRHYWSDGDAVGKRLRIRRPQSEGPWLTVVGIVRNVKSQGLDAETLPEMYLPYLQQPPLNMTVAVRTDNNPKALARAVQGKITEVDADQPIYNVAIMEDIMAVSTQRRQFSTLLLSIFAVIALVLASIGIYGVLSYSFAQRKREIAVRMAVGASRPELLRMVLGQGMRTALIGLGIGLVAAFALSRALVGLLFGVGATDPAVFIATPIALAIVAFLGSYIPAQRAVKVDPATALRQG